MNEAKWYLFWAPLYHLITLMAVVFLLALTVVCSLLWPFASVIGVGLMCWIVALRTTSYWRAFSNKKKRDLGLLPPPPLPQSNPFRSHCYDDEYLAQPGEGLGDNQFAVPVETSMGQPEIIRCVYWVSTWEFRNTA